MRQLYFQLSIAIMRAVLRYKSLLYIICTVFYMCFIFFVLAGRSYYQLTMILHFAVLAAKLIANSAAPVAVLLD